MLSEFSIKIIPYGLYSPIEAFLCHNREEASYIAH